jgi:hypothetical protein
VYLEQQTELIEETANKMKLFEETANRMRILEEKAQGSDARLERLEQNTQGMHMPSFFPPLF